MSEPKGRFEWVVTVARIALVITLLCLAAVIVVTVSAMILAAQDGKGWMDLVLHAIAIVAVIVAAAWFVAIYGLLRVWVATEAAAMYNTGAIGRIETLLDDQAVSARKLIELSTLSDEAKSLLYRDRELEAMREMMHGMLVRQDYRSADELIQSIERRPAYAEEAAVMRQELLSTRQASIEDKVNLSVSRVEEIIARGDWARATREVKRMLQAFPASEKVAALPGRIEIARARAKTDLLQAYDDAVRRNDIEGSINLLKELDRYLSPQEAAALQDSARGVLKAKLHNLGVQFAIRVTEGQWPDAITVGETIMRDYPNSRMAHEVQSKMDQLRQRAAAAVVKK